MGAGCAEREPLRQPRAASPVSSPPRRAAPTPAAAAPEVLPLQPDPASQRRRPARNSLAPVDPRPVGPLVQEMRALLKREARRVPGRLAAFWWEDLETGETATVRPDLVFKSASLIKIPVAAAVLERWERQPELRTPEREQALWQMICESDNVVVDDLAGHAGGLAAVNSFSRSQGWRDTSMNYYFRNWRTRSRHNYTSPRDCAAMLRAIDRRCLVSEAASEKLWELLKDQQVRQRIPSGIPEDAGAEVGSKTGTLLSVLHDVAIVRAANARYLLCILTAGPRSEPAGDAYCRRLSRAVWDLVTSAGPPE